MPPPPAPPLGRLKFELCTLERPRSALRCVAPPAPTPWNALSRPPLKPLPPAPPTRSLARDTWPVFARFDAPPRSPPADLSAVPARLPALDRSPPDARSPAFDLSATDARSPPFDLSATDARSPPFERSPAFERSPVLLRSPAFALSAVLARAPLPESRPRKSLRPSAPPTLREYFSRVALSRYATP